MDYLKLFLDTFKDTPTLIFGDLNARFGQPQALSNDISYRKNPDTTVNQNGRIC